MIHFSDLRPKTRSIVRFEGRVFRVKVDDQGRARSVHERKVRPDGVIRDETYWHCSQPLPWPGRKGRRKSIVREVLDLAGAPYDHLWRESV